MTRAMLVVAGVLLAGVVGADDTKPKEIKFEKHSGYFEKNTSGLKGESTYLAIDEAAAFDKTFGVGFVMGKRPNLVPKDAWGKQLVVAAIKRGNAIVEYSVEKVTRLDDTITVHYKATKGPEGSATFASPLILSVEKGDCKTVVFVENGKEAAKVKVGK